MTQPQQERTDQELARESRAGSLVAFEELVFRYEKRIYSFLCSKAPNPSDAEDLLQQVFIKAFRNIARYNGTYAFYTWLLAIARREVAGFYRSWHGQPVEYEGELAADERDPARELDGRDQGEFIWQLAKQTLPDAQYTALLLVYREELSVKDAARVMKRTVSSVKVLLFRARKKLAATCRLESDAQNGGVVPMEDSPCFVS
ncbi:RNA polymerase sigma factor [Pontiella sp.]|uniref:RNA polymerase sigma factor n=1 Tax=Pontiella sp. TaxID=2837462 RepID=UPI00356959A7